MAAGRAREAVREVRLVEVAEGDAPADLIHPSTVGGRRHVTYERSHARGLAARDIRRSGALQFGEERSAARVHRGSIVPGFLAQHQPGAIAALSSLDF